MVEKGSDNPSFDIRSIFPTLVVNSRGEMEPFDINDIKRKLHIETGLDEQISQDICDKVVKKIIAEGKKEVQSLHIKDLVVAELSMAGLDKYKTLFSADHERFYLDSDFVNEYKGKQPDWGPLGYITYKRTYARVKNDDTKEEFWETLKRVVEGCYSIQKTHCKRVSIPWDEEKAQHSAQKMYDLIWKFRFTPPGRGMWIMGTEFVRRHGSMALNNCFSHDTEIITKEGIKKIGDCAGTSQTLLSKGGKWIDAPIKSFGTQKLVELVVDAMYGDHHGPSKHIFCTPDHNWIVRTENAESKMVKTRDLREGVKLETVYADDSDITKRLVWKVYKMEETDREEEVYCATVPETHSFALEGNILTGNCGFCSTENIDMTFSKPFEFMMDALMLGVGVGFDTKGAGKIEIQRPAAGSYIYSVPDNREGWVKGLKLLLNAYFKGEQKPEYKYHMVRPKGAPIRGFGGKASGPDPLRNMYHSISELLENRIGTTLTSVDIVDIMNFIGKCVVAGNVRRCLAEEMKVHSKRGILPIKNLRVGDLVLTSDGSYRKVTDIFDQGIQDTIKITTSHGSIECTPNHRVAVYDGLKSFGWKHAGELTDDDRLISTFHSGGINGISEDEMWLIGYYHGDGNSDYLRRKETKHGGGSVTLAMSTENYNNGLKDKCFSILRKMGFDPKPYFQDNSAWIGIHDVSFAERMLKYKKPHHPPVITEAIWNGTPEMRASYLAGLTDSDGGKRNVLLHSTRLDFIRDVQKIALSLGIATTLHERDPRYNEKYDKTYRGSHYLHIRGIESQNRAKELIEPYCAIWKCKLKRGKKNGLSIPHQIILDAREKGEIDFPPLSSGLIRGTKSSGQKYKDANFDTLIERGLVNPDWIPIEIESIEPNGQKHTYDIEVERNHNFICEGFLVHNSAEIALGHADDDEYIEMKDYTKYQEECDDRRWASNNSVIAEVGMDYSDIAEQIALNGEPGIFWLGNAQKYSRMDGRVDWKDKKVAGINPCFSGDTLIAVADGRGAVTIQQLAEEGKDIPVYSLDENGLVVIKMGRHPRITGYDKELLKITLEDGSSVSVTPDHKMLLFPNTPVYADKLRVGDELPKLFMCGENIENHQCIKITGIKQIDGKETVYNITVDDHHTVGVVTDFNSETRACSGIFTKQCGEQSLESFELCNLCEVFISRHDEYNEFEETLKYAYLYAKSVTLMNTHWKETNAIMLKNRRIGTSLTGIMDAFTIHGKRKVLEWCQMGYKYLRKLDEDYSNWLAVPKSIKITTVKPSGSVSLLPGVSAGIHYPHSEYYIRRIRIANESKLIDILKDAGYSMEPIKTGEKTMMVVSFPVKEEHFDRGKKDVTMWEQLQNAADLQRYWSDNQVSITVTFKRHEAGDIAHALESFEDKLKSVAMLPLVEHGYEQAPYEEITKEQYLEMKSRIKPLNLSSYNERAIGEIGCDADGGSCDVRFGGKRQD